MYDPTSDEARRGHEAEKRAGRLLAQQGWKVVLCAWFVGNTPNTLAPMLMSDEGDLVLPDLMAFHPTRGSLWVEVKTKRVPGYRHDRGRWEHGIAVRQIREYQAVQEQTGVPLRIMLREENVPASVPNPSLGTVPGPLWMEADLDTILSVGVEEPNWTKEEAGWLFPRSAMTIVAGLDEDADIELPPHFGAGPPQRHLAALGLDTSPRHSLLLCGEAQVEAVSSLLRHGVRVFWLVETVPDGLPERGDPLREMLLSVHEVDGPPPDLQLVDGEGANAHRQALLELADRSDFNARQYLIEHEDPERNVVVRAGAGSGKTRVMVHRVLFLLATTDLEPTDIAMITFTRAARREMRVRLAGELARRVILTRRPEPLTWLLALPGIRIQTIHAFSRELLSALCTRVGLGHGFSVRGLKQQRTRILRRCLDEILDADQQLSGQLGPHRRLYELERTIHDVWTTLDNEGLTPEEVQGLDWGGADAGDARILNDLLARLMDRATGELVKVKEELGVVELSDLPIQLQRLAAGGRIPANVVPRQIFIDEFQDTDDGQIETAIALARDAGARLFVVGDVKQSIYRFRGANHTAFARFEAGLPDELAPRHHALVRNYRTAPEVLDVLHGWFSIWATDGLLTYSDADRLRPMSRARGRIEIHPVRGRGRQAGRDTAWRAIAAALSDPERSGPVTVLVRRNAQAEEVRQLCADNGTACDIERGGGFYQSTAVREFLVLVRALRRQASPADVYALTGTSWVVDGPPWGQLWSAQGDLEPLRELLSDWQPHRSWTTWTAALRTRPVLSVLFRMASVIDPASVYYKRRLDAGDAETVALAAARHYQVQLQRLFTLLQETFSSDWVSLTTLETWLSMRRATDSDEDEATVHEDNTPNTRAPVRCVTVHKAKGLEFDTVVVPFTTDPFISQRRQTFVVWKDPGRMRAAWRGAGTNPIVNDHWNQLVNDEHDEQRMEECRLLYVALTRTERSLHVVSAGARPDTWSALIASGRQP